MALDSHEMTILGRMYDVRTSGPIAPGSSTLGRNRVIVEGINKNDGTPVRFKSVERATNHIRNMRLGRV